MQTPSTELGIFIFVETYRTYGKFYDYEDAAEFCNHVEHIHEVKP